MTAAAPISPLTAARLVHEENGRYSCSTMALHKLLYLAHGYHLAWYGVPLVDEEFEVRKSGPVLINLVRVHSGVYSTKDSLEIVNASLDGVADTHRKAIKAVVQGMGGLSGPELSERTLRHAPVRNETLDNDTLRAFFAAEAAGLDKIQLSSIADPDYRAQVLLDSLDEETKKALWRAQWKEMAGRREPVEVHVSEVDTESTGQESRDA